MPTIKSHPKKPSIFLIPKKIKIGLTMKVIGLITFLIMVVSTITTVELASAGINALKDEIHSKLISIASTISYAIDSDQLKLIHTRSDENTPVYHALQQKLQQIQKGSRDKLRYIYAVARINQKYVYVMDATPQKSEDHSFVGDPFPTNEYPEAIHGFQYPTAENQPIFDKEFKVYSQSGYVPIKDKSGTVIGMLGIDMDVSTIKAKEQGIITAGIHSFFISLILALILGIAFSKYLVNPILTLMNGTRKIAAGDLDTQVHLNRRDEFAELANSLNAMTLDLKISHDKLTNQNSQLEQTVSARTVEISKINQQIRDILDSMEEGIFTFGPDLRINSEYSRYATEIFGPLEFSGQRFLEVLFPDPSQQAIRDQLEQWLDLIFSDQSFMDWNDIEPLQPINEITFHNAQDPETHFKYVRISFKPILDEANSIRKMMLIAVDITDMRVLEMAVVKKEQEYKENINDIIEAIQLDQELFEDFVKECQDLLVDFEPKLLQLRSEKNNPHLINELFRYAHTIKGNAAHYKLERIAGEMNEIETIFANIRNGDRQLTDPILDTLFTKIDVIQNLFTEITAIYHKINQNRNRDLGKTLTDQHSHEESEIIKVRVEDINHLSELINRAENLINQNPPNSFAIGTMQNSLHHILSESEQKLLTMKKVAISRLFARFPRMVRDISMELGKDVNLLINNSDLIIDKNIFDKIGDPLIHILRNSLDHGIEAPAEREALGKPRQGTIEISLEQKPAELHIQVTDDGRGIDLDRVKQKALAKGLITQQQMANMTDTEIINLIFHPGFSTYDRPTKLSGRGVGMNAVKVSVEEILNGTIAITSEKNQGFAITLSIPVVDAES